MESDENKSREGLLQEVQELRGKYATATHYIRQKVNQLLKVMGTAPLRAEELDDVTLISLDPIGIVSDSFAQVLEHLKEKNEDMQVTEEMLREQNDQLLATEEMLREQNDQLLATEEMLRVQINEYEAGQNLLKESEERFRNYIINSPNGVFVCDENGRYVDVNPAACSITGYDEAELLTMTLPDLLPPESMEWLVRSFQEVLETGRTSGEAAFRRKNGEIGYWSLSGVQLSPTKLIGFVTDISERKEYEKERLKMEKLESIGLLAGGIAHDFNNILTGIMGNISFAQMFLDDTHKSYKPLVEAEKASARAGELAHQLLTFARGGEPVKKVVSLQHLVNETVSLVLHGSNVKGTVDIPDTIHAIEADEGQMSQVFHNIIINAAQAMPEGGTLTVTAQNKTISSPNALMQPAGMYVKISLTDQGVGIAKDDLKRIFDPYFTTKSEGNGLGLASVHSIIKRHGGNIGVISVVGKGSTFTIHLPSIGEPFQKYQSDSVSQTTGNHLGGSILVMDDEEVIRDMTTDMLEYLGYQAKTCENGLEAIAAYKASIESGAPFSAVIMDLTIPGGMGGKEAACQILAIDPKACLIVSSGYSNDPIMSDYTTHGFTGAVAKPYKIMEFGQLLSTVLAAR